MKSSPHREHCSVMDTATDPTGRRPLKTRSALWAASLASALTRSGLSPNAISGISVVFALMGASACLFVSPSWLGWLLFAICIQLRLLCNLMDGMVAVEGGKKSAVGELWNEIPDRVADSVFLLAAGWAVDAWNWGVAATLLSLMTAYLRALGFGLTQKQDFSGPGAKPHRMAILTLGSLVVAATSSMEPPLPIMTWTLMIITVATALTAVRRTARLAAELNHGASS